MNGDLISREVLTDVIERMDWYHVNSKGELVHGATSATGLYRFEDIMSALENAPAVESEPVVHAHWTSEIVKKCDWKGQKRDYYQPYSCPVCHTPDLRKGESKYCSECGAKMDVEVSE